MFSLRKLLFSSAVLVLVLSLCTGLTFADGSKATTTDDRVNIREEASTDAKVLETISNKGTSVTVISSSENWVKVKYNGVTGWIRKDLLSIKPEEKKTVSGTGVVKAETLNVRSKADLSAGVVAKLKEGEKVSILDQSGEWYKIKTSDGEVGWVYAEYISTKKADVSRGSKSSRGDDADRSKAVAEDDESVADENDTQEDTTTGQEIVAYAKKFIGTKYVYGGDSPKEGFDCSGFVKYVFAHFDIKLERTSADQATQGKKVKKANLRIGDLVFFDTNGGRSNINHVGIYIGDGKFIHASSPRYDVTITELSDDYYARSYMTSRRIIN
ncbi:MAG: SH3 domain-containing protein [Clostridia bacterium]|nr:SH3 domain-containing protein [Clostridia bacterium]